MLAVPLVVAAVTWLTFCVWYGTRATWWRSAIGRNTMVTSGLLAAIFSRLATLTLWPDLRADLVVTGTAIYVLAAALGVHRIVLLERAQRSARHAANRKPVEPPGLI